MSASLVGSEMCIRDSLWTGCVSRAHDHPAQEEHLAHLRAWRARGGSEAVSYTHLTLPTICSV
eukprot:3401118-Alexandrium_andersonii.AAC.1